MSASTSIEKASPSSLAPSGERWTWHSILTTARDHQLEQIMQTAGAPAMQGLIGHEWSGGNCRVLYRLLGIRRFVKGFYEGPPRASEGPTPFVQGYNIACPNLRDDEPTRCKPSDDAPDRYGFYRAHAVVPGARDSRYANALLLDYGLGANGVFGAPLRDYLVQVYPDDPDLLLGKAYLAFGPIRVFTNFFVLSRWREHSFSG